jgi:hypothetical protein
MSATETQCFPMTDKGSSDVTAALIDSNDPTKGVTLTYALYTFDGWGRITVIAVTCDPKADSATFTFDSETVDGSVSTYHFKMSSKYACPGAAPAPSNNLPLGQLGVGGLIIILLFVFLALYFIIGALVCKFALKKEGKEIIPNVGVSQINFFSNIRNSSGWISHS